MAKKATAKVFMSGSSQAVRLPMEYRFECEEVVVHRRGNSLVLTPVPKTWDDLIVHDDPMPKELVEKMLSDSDLLPLEQRATID